MLGMIEKSYKNGRIIYPSFGSFSVICWYPFGNNEGMVVRILTNPSFTNPTEYPKALFIRITKEWVVTSREMEAFYDPVNTGVPYWKKLSSVPDGQDLKDASRTVSLALNQRFDDINVEVKKFLGIILKTLT